jgi:hypothetical protein
MEKHCAMKSLICERRWDTDVLVSDVEVGVQRTPAQLCTKLQYCGGKPACLRCQEDANVKQDIRYRYREFANFAIVVSYVGNMLCSFVFLIALNLVHYS